MNVHDLTSTVFDTSLSDAERLAAAVELLENQHCPYDCDNCHSDDCPCDRLGCAGAK